MNWSKRRDLAPFFASKGLPLGVKGRFYFACLRSVISGIPRGFQTTTYQFRHPRYYISDHKIFIAIVYKQCETLDSTISLLFCSKSNQNCFLVTFQHVFTSYLELASSLLILNICRLKVIKFK